MNNFYELIIIGAGPIGLACAIEAAKNKVNYIILEKGCLVNSLYNYPLNMSFFSTSEKLEIGDIPFISHQTKPNRSESLEYFRRVSTTWDLKIQLYTTVKSITKNDDVFSLKTSGGENFSCKNVIIATGFFDIPNLMHVEGEDLPHVHHYFKEAHPFVHQKVVVVGCANSAVDAALECYRKGAEVVMVIRQSEISPRIKYWIKPDIENRIKEGSIKCFYHAEVERITKTHIEINTPDGKIRIQSDHILALTGYKPNFDFLKAAGVKLNGEKLIPTFDPETMESNIAGLYLAGVVCGGTETHKWFIENSRIHAEMIIKDIVSKN